MDEPLMEPDESDINQDEDGAEEKHAKVEDGVENNSMDSSELMNFMLLFYMTVMEN